MTPVREVLWAKRIMESGNGDWSYLCSYLNNCVKIVMLKGAVVHQEELAGRLEHFCSAVTMCSLDSCSRVPSHEATFRLFYDSERWLRRCSIPIVLVTWNSESSFMISVTQIKIYKPVWHKRRCQPICTSVSRLHMKDLHYFINNPVRDLNKCRENRNIYSPCLCQNASSLLRDLSSHGKW